MPTRDLAFNLLNGTLPAEYSRITGMRVMNVENNYLTGTLPAAWSTMKRLETLCGSPPPLAMHSPRWELRRQLLPGPRYRRLADVCLRARRNLAYNTLRGSLPGSWSSWLQVTEM